ncbi:MAG TPA: HIT family protein [Candidatus Dormibacteraeota bacterium]|nr:HIT family protein [Candidatus Dormibacteraeota bacterium]
MARLARVVVANLPHHVTQRGNARQSILRTDRQECRKTSRLSPIAVHAVERAMGAEGTFVAIHNRVSQSVPHLYVHVVPRRKGDGMHGFFWPRQKYPDPSTEREVAEAIRAVLAASQTSKP